MAAPPWNMRDAAYYGPMCYGQYLRGVDAMFLRNDVLWEHQIKGEVQPDGSWKWLDPYEDYIPFHSIDPFEENFPSAWFVYTETAQAQDKLLLPPPKSWAPAPRRWGKSI